MSKSEKSKPVRKSKSIKTVKSRKSVEVIPPVPPPIPLRSHHVIPAILAEMRRDWTGCATDPGYVDRLAGVLDGRADLEVIGRLRNILSRVTFVPRPGFNSAKFFFLANTLLAAVEAAADGEAERARMREEEAAEWLAAAWNRHLRSCRI